MLDRKETINRATIGKETKTKEVKPSMFTQAYNYVMNNKIQLVLGLALTASLYQHYEYTPLVIEREIQKNDVIYFDSVDKDYMVIDLKAMYVIKDEEMKMKDGTVKHKLAKGLEMDNGRSIYLTIFENKESKTLTK